MVINMNIAVYCDVTPWL